MRGIQFLKLKTAEVLYIQLHKYSNVATPLLVQYKVSEILNDRITVRMNHYTKSQVHKFKLFYHNSNVDITI